MVIIMDLYLKMEKSHSIVFPFSDKKKPIKGVISGGKYDFLGTALLRRLLKKQGL